MTIVAFVSRQRLTGRTNGSSAYLLDLADAVRSAGMTPVLVQPSPTLMGRTPVAAVAPEMGVFAAHRARGVARLGGRLVSGDGATWAAAVRGALAAAGRRAGISAGWTRDRPAPYSVAVPWTARDHAFAARALADADVVIGDYMFQGDAFADAPAGAPTAIVMHDLFHARDIAGEAGSGRDAVAGIDAAEEARLLARADAVIAIQRTEADWVAAHVPATRAILAPMASPTVASPQPGEDDLALFVGSATAPNVVGLRWFLDEAWPAVRRVRPHARLMVAGGVRRAFAGPVDGVEFLGLVDRLEPLYARAGVVISPLTTGSGLKIKLVEALAQGKAIVATGVTLQGVERECADAVARADQADAFARATAGLLGDAAARAALAERALATARAHFSAEACHRELIAWLREVAPRR